MSSSDYQQLVAFLNGQFITLNRHFTTLRAQLTGVETRLAGLADQVAALETRRKSDAESHIAQ